MFDSNKLIPNLEKQNLWLGEVNSQLFQGMIKHIESAFNKFFREKNDFLKFKSKMNHSKTFFDNGNNILCDS